MFVIRIRTVLSVSDIYSDLIHTFLQNEWTEEIRLKLRALIRDFLVDQGYRASTSVDEGRPLLSSPSLQKLPIRFKRKRSAMLEQGFNSIEPFTRSKTGSRILTRGVISKAIELDNTGSWLQGLLRVLC